MAPAESPSEGERKMKMFKYTIIFAAIAGLVLALAPAAQAVVIDTVHVGNAGNTADGTGYGAVADVYNIGKYEVSNEEYCEFLNAVAPNDANALYATNMGTQPRGGITRSGSSPSYSYTTRANMADKPVNFVKYNSMARFVNWLHNGQPTGAQDTTTTEDGAYDLSTSYVERVRKSGWTWGLPTSDEWYKAAYYDPNKSGGPGYWDYPTGVDTPVPTAVEAVDTGDFGNMGDGRNGPNTDGSNTPVTSGNFANFNNVADWNGQNGNVTTVGTNGGPSPYGTFDQGGNLKEWLDTLTTPAEGGYFQVFGGAYNDGSNNMKSGVEGWGYTYPNNPTENIGFRVVQVPEPATMALLLIGAPLLALRRRRRA